ncbi:hypothetical protein [Actinomadura bangladeshensis]|uniref:Uncharacterized protein n=1 Tax=Actinomadura bangladeshensis TaxID=453573 RepID=A0A6L9QLX4_9ACTN|nr:hypothetical protein [Actinomadura bangladeshensis]NEA25034.1 hypothetical protein [Actinomadura bangladeshensis]
MSERVARESDGGGVRAAEPGVRGSGPGVRASVRSSVRPVRRLRASNGSSRPEPRFRTSNGSPRPLRRLAGGGSCGSCRARALPSRRFTSRRLGSRRDDLRPRSDQSGCSDHQDPSGHWGSSDQLP